VHSVRKPWWQQATALVTVSTGGVITGFTIVPGAAGTITSPSNVPLHLMALEKAAKPADSGDDRLRPAIVNVAGYYLQLAQSRTPAQMEALIWGKDSLDGVDHGPSCAAFASLTLELAAQAVGQQSWVSGGGTYPWPLHQWADGRVNPNPDSLGITSIVQDAQAHQRWHPLGDGYQPQPGDWVVFDGHVEVVTSYANGVLDSIGADSLPNLTVNAHSFPAPLAQQGVEGFVDNGHLGGSAVPASSAPAVTAAPAKGASPVRTAGPSSQPERAAIPGVVSPTGGAATGGAATSAPAHSSATAHAQADIPGAAVAAGLGGAASSPSSAGTAKPAAPRRNGAPYQRHTAPGAATPATKTQQAFINQIAPGALAAQQRFGVPASVTIAQAIDESGWGTSQLAANDYNLFGIKGSGPAGSVTLPTQEFENGQWVTIYAQFRVYHNVSESISDHAELLATSGYYTRAMADRTVPDAFANDLTGVYATDPEYGANLIAIMKLYNLYRFDSPTSAQAQPSAPSAAASHAPAAHASPSPPPGSQASVPGLFSALEPGASGPGTPSQAHSSVAQQSGAAVPGIMSGLAGTPARNPARAPAAMPSTSPATNGQPAGSPAWSPTQAPAAQPSAAHPSTAQPSGADSSGSQASVPGMMSALAGSPSPAAHPATAPPSIPGMLSALGSPPTPSAPQTATASPTPAHARGASPVTPRPSASQASNAGMPSTPTGSPTPSATHAATAQPTVTHPPAASPAAPQPSASQPSIPGILSPVPGKPTPSATQTPVTAADGHAGVHASAAPSSAAAHVHSSPGEAAVPGTGAAAPSSPAPQGYTGGSGTAASPATGSAPAGPGTAVPGAVTAPPPSAPPQGHTTAYLNSVSYEPTVPYGNSAATAPGATAIPGPAVAAPAVGVAGVRAAQPARRRAGRTSSQTRSAARVPGVVAPRAVRYETPLPSAVATAFFAKAKGPLGRAEQLHRDVAGRAGIRWQLLAACDWMQCHADHMLSPVNGERLGSVNPDGTVYHTKSQALAQCASDLIYLAGAVYGLDLTARRALPVRALADVFAAFRWGGLLKRHGVSAMDFPYSVAGLTEQHLKMHWPVIDEPDAPDRQGSKFRGPFGAVPVLLTLNYPALV